MKSVIAIACLLSAVSVGADIIDIYLETIKDQVMPCARESGYTEDNLREIFEKDSSLGVDGSTCVRACTMKALGMMNGLNVELARVNTFINTVHVGKPETVVLLEKAAADCLEKAKTMTEECKMAFVYIDCFLSSH